MGWILYNTILFFLHPKPRDKQEITYLLKRDGISVPVCIDEKDRLNSINKFSTRDDYQCFLLDKDNKVVSIGNPVHNIRVKEMYLSTIAPGGYTITTPSRNTIVNAEQTEFDLGTIKQGNTTKITASIRNVGEVPLVVQDIRASCGCTSIRYTKEPILPGSSLKVEITYNAEDRGRFNRSVAVYGNMDNSPLIIRLKGNTN